MEKLNKITGAIVGMTIGDILANPLKNLTKNEKSVYLPITKLVEPFDLNDKLESTPKEEKHFNILKQKIENHTPSGYYSFVIQYALLVLDSLSQFSAFDVEDISQKLIKYSYPRDKHSPLGIYREYTNEFYDSIKNIMNGLPLRVCGNASNTGDSPIQAIPISLLYKNNTKTIMQSSIDLTLLTHKTIYDCAASASISYAAGRTSVTSFFKIDEELDSIIKIAKETEEQCIKRYGSIMDLNQKYIHIFSDTLKTLYDLKNQSIEHGIEELHKRNNNAGLKQNSCIVNSIGALFIFMKNIGNYEQAIKSCFEHQNLNSEIAAPIVGALSGGLLGIEKIPTKWRKLYSQEDYLKPIIENLFKEEKKLKTKNFFINEIELDYEIHAIKKQQIYNLEKAFNTSEIYKKN